MINKIIGMVSLFVTILLLGCTPANPPGPASTQQLPNILVLTEGTVTLRRSGWSEYSPVSFGTIVETGDILRVMEGGQAAVFCGNPDALSKDAIPIAADGKEHGVPCQQGAPPRPWPDVAALRGETEDHLPYVITPRNSALISRTPDLVWHMLPEVKKYNLTLISDDGVKRPSVQVDGNSSAWPSEWNAMQGNAVYVLIVEGNGRRSDDNNKTHSRLGFWLLEEDVAAELELQENQIRQAPISEPARALLVADLYAGYQLQAEALQLLEWISSVESSPVIYLKAGQIYLESGNLQEAQILFEQAYELAQVSGDLEAGAQAEYGLGLVFQVMNSKDQANAAFIHAREQFKSIGDQESILRIDNLLKP